LTQLDLVSRPSPNGRRPSLEERRRTLFDEGSPYAPAERSEIVGIEHVLERVDEVLHWLVYAERYAQPGSRLEPGVLFAGPPGTGKTLAARYLAAASGAIFVDARAFPTEESSLQPSDVQALFRRAREARLAQARPLILFWDELDAVVCATRPFGNQRATDLCHSSFRNSTVSAERATASCSSPARTHPRRSRLPFAGGAESERRSPSTSPT